MRILFRSKGLENRLITFKKNQIARKRKQRMDRFLEAGMLGKGKNVTTEDM